MNFDLKNIYKNCVTSSSFWAVNKQLVYYFKDANLVLYLDELCTRADYFSKKLGGDDYFYVEQKEIELTTGFSPHRQRKFLDILKAEQCVSTKNGIGNKLFYYVHAEQIMLILSQNREGLQKLSNLTSEVKKINFPYNKNINNKEFIRINSSRVAPGTRFGFGNISKEEARKQKIIKMLQEYIPINFSYKRNKPMTKTLTRAVELIEHIMSGEFQNYPFNESVFNSSAHTRAYNFDAVKGLTGLDKLESLLKKSGARFSAMKENGMWPERKEILPSSIDGFFFNSKTGKSFFLHCLTNRPKPVQEVAYNQKIEHKWQALEKMVGPQIRGALLSFWDGNFFEVWSPAEQLKFLNTMQAFITWYQENKNNLQNANGNHTILSNELILVSRLADFLRAHYSIHVPECIAIGGRNFKAFEKYLGNNWGIKLTGLEDTTSQTEDIHEMELRKEIKKLAALYSAEGIGISAEALKIEAEKNVNKC